MALDPVNAKAVKGKFKDREDKDLDNDGDSDASDEYLHKRRSAVSKAIKNVKEAKLTPDQMRKALDDDKAEAKSKDKVSLKKAPWDMKESVELDEAKRDAADFEAMDPPNGIDYDDKNLRKLNWKMYDDKAIRDIIKRADSNADERSPHGPDYQASGKVYYQNIIKAAKAELKKRGIKEEVELDEVTVANSPAAFDLKKRAEAYKRNMIKFQQTPGQDAHDKFLKARTALINSLKKLKQMDLPKAELDALRKGTNIFESAEDVDEAKKPKSNSMIRAALVAKALKNVKKEATYSDTGWQA